MTKTKKTRSVHGLWSSPWLFVLAAIGFVVGLKNIWQFPYHLGQYGGGAFLLVYAIFIFALGVPLLMAQLMLGRLGRQSPIHTLHAMVRRTRVSHRWELLAWLSVAAGFLILSYYSVIAGWMLAYMARSASGALHSLTVEGAGSVFSAFVKDPEKQLFWHSLFMLMTMVVAARGLRGGLEPVIRYVVPVIFLLLVMLVGYAAGAGQFAQGAEQLLYMDFTKLTRAGIYTAMGDAFFSLGLGVATMMAYGAYLPQHAPIARVSVLIVVADIVTGVLAGLAIFPVLLAGGTAPAAGPGLVFQTLAVAFDSLPLGGMMRALFFVLLVLVSWVSTIALIEPAMAWLVERFAISRFRAAVLAGATAWLLGVVSILSFNYWGFSFTLLGVTKTLGFFDVLLILTSLLMLPVCGILFAWFAGWVVKPEVSREELAMRSPCAHDLWLWLVRLVIPAVLLLILFNMRVFL